MERIKIILPDRSERMADRGSTVEEVAYSISPRLGKAAVAGKIGDKLVNLGYRLEEDTPLSIVTMDSDEGLEIYRHTAAHVLAQAVKRLYNGAKLAIGPAIADGFYYDFDVERPFSPDDLERIESEMERIIKEDLPIVRIEVSMDEAIKLFEDKGEVYKVELLGDLDDSETISMYRQGEFVDLCRGPHLKSTGGLKAFKLLRSAGAYWKGNERNKMLQRIYGTAFPKKTQLEDHLQALKEAEARDHNKLGRELDLFMTSEPIGQGLPLLKPKGAKVIQILQRFVEDEEERRGYQFTKTPFMAKSDLYKISGHWDHYRDGMFILGDEEKGEEILALRPMTCPFQFMIYKSKVRSYRDLPIKYAETSSLFRNESSGEMHGLIRVRQFTISEGHLICTPDQLEEEFKGVLDLINYMMRTLGIQNDIWFRFSKWDPNNKEKYIDNPEAWEDTQRKMKNILNNVGIDYTEADGEAAFYGPKLDIQTKNVYGKEDTIITVQIDFSLPERFDMTFVDKDNKKKRPYVIHRTSIGCYERTLAILIEKYAGAFPTWLAPVQAVVIPVADSHREYAAKVEALLRDAGVRVHLDDRQEKIGYRIREAQMMKIPYMLVIGDREAESNQVAVRSRSRGDLGSMAVEDFKKKLIEEIGSRSVIDTVR